MQTKEEAFAKLKKSTFRSHFRLSPEDKKFIENKGMDTVRQHAEEFVAKKLAPAYPFNDGKQTPMHGHPVFKAQHACACCCRGCLEKWYNVKKGVALTPELQKRIVDFLMAWIEKEYKRIR